jgi:hypothetical protein
MNVESFEGFVLDPCCGSGSIPSVCLERGIPATGSDIVYRGFGEVRDLFTLVDPVDNMTFWESRARHQFFEEHPPIRYWPCGDRPSMPPGRMAGERDRWGAMVQPESRGGTMPYGWFIFERGFTGGTMVRRLPLRGVTTGSHRQIRGEARCGQTPIASNTTHCP